MCPERFAESPLNSDTRIIGTLRNVPLVFILPGSTVFGQSDKYLGVWFYDDVQFSEKCPKGMNK